MTRFFKFAALVVFVAYSSSSVAVGQFNHPDAIGPNISYTNIFETTNTNSPLFGAPTPDGDNLDFPVPGFSANAVDADIDFLNGQVSLEASSNSGQTFDSVELSEFGVYFNNGSTAFSSVTTFMFVTVNGMTFSDSITQDFTGTGSGAWSASFDIAIPETTTATIQVHNILLSQAGAGEVASISKRDADIRINPVPEPATAGLIGAALCGLVLRRRRS